MIPFGGGVDMLESMFYVGVSFIFKVPGGPKIAKFRDDFRKGVQVRPYETRLEILVVLGCPWGSRRGQFQAKNGLA